MNMNINPYCADLAAQRAESEHYLKDVGDQWRTPDSLFWGIAMQNRIECLLEAIRIKLDLSEGREISFAEVCWWATLTIPLPMIGNSIGLSISLSREILTVFGQQFQDNSNMELINLLQYEPIIKMAPDVLYLKDKNDQDWYESQKLFSDSTMKMGCDSNGVILMASVDVSTLWPEGLGE